MAQPKNFVIDDELQTATPAQCKFADGLSAQKPSILSTNPFYSDPPTNCLFSDKSKTDPLTHERPPPRNPGMAIISSPDMALVNKKTGARAKSGNPLLQKLSKLWDHNEEIKSEEAKNIKNTISFDRVSFNTVAPGTPKSSSGIPTFERKMLNKTADTTISVKSKLSACTVSYTHLTLPTKRIV